MLHLGGNAIGDAGAHHLAKGIWLNSALEEVRRRKGEIRMVYLGTDAAGVSSRMCGGGIACGVYGGPRRGEEVVGGEEVGALPEKRARRPAGTGRCGGARPGRRLGASAGGRSKHPHSRVHLVLRPDRTARAAAAVKLSRRVARASTLSLPHRVSSLGCRSPPPARVLPSRDEIGTNENPPKLRLGSNGIGDAGARALGESLLRNRALRCLDLWGNRVSRRGAESLMRALDENGALSVARLPLRVASRLEPSSPPRLYVRCLIDWEV